MKAILSIAILAISLATANATALGQVDWKDATRLQKESDGKSVYYIRSENVILCREVEEDVWTDPRIWQATKDATPVWVEASVPDNRSLIHNLQVHIVPTLIVRQNGTEVARLERSTDREEYLAALTGQPTGSPPKAAPDSQPWNPVVESDTADDSSGGTALDITSLLAGWEKDQFRVTLELAGQPNMDWPAGYNIFLETDNNPDSGFRNENVQGADWLLQGRNLHEFTGKTRTEWAWTSVAEATSEAHSRSLHLRLPAAMLGVQPQRPLSVRAFTQNTSWQDVDWAPNHGMLKTGGKNSPVTISPDGQPVGTADTGTGTAFSDTSNDAAPELDIVSALMKTDGDSLVIGITIRGTAAPGPLHVFFDSDSNRSTGYGSESRQGAEFMIEGSNLYRHSGPKQVEWVWEPIMEVPFTQQGNTVFYRIPRSRVGAVRGEPMNVWFATTDQSWNVADFLPDSGVQVYQGN